MNAIKDNISWLEKITGLQYPPEIRQLLTILTEMEEAPPVKFFYGPFSDVFTVMDFNRLGDIRHKTYFHLNNDDRYLNPYAMIGLITEYFEDIGKKDANATPFLCLPFAYDYPGLRYLAFTGKEGELAAIQMEMPEILLFNTGQLPLFNINPILEQIRLKQPVLLKHPRLTQFVSKDFCSSHSLYHGGGDRWYQKLMKDLASVAYEEMQLDHFEGNDDGEKLYCVLEVNGERSEFSLIESEEADVSIIYYLNELLRKTNIKNRFCVCSLGNSSEELIFAFVDDQEYAALKSNFFLYQANLWDR